MNFRVTAIIFGLTVALVVALFVVSYRSDENDETKADDGILGTFSSKVKESEVDTVEIARTEPSEQKLVFVKEGTKWELREPFRAKVNGADVDAVVRALYKAKPTKYAELTDNLTLHGLDKPTVKVSLKKAESSVSVSLGLTTLGGSDAVTFLTTSVNPKRPIAVKKNELSAIYRESARTKDGPAWELSRWLADYRVRKLLGTDMRDPAAEATAVKLAVNGKELALTRSTSGSWTFVSPAGFGEADDLGDAEARPGAAAITGVRPLLSTLTGLQSFSPDDYIEQPENLAKYGLADGDPTRLRIELTPQTGQAEVVYIGKAVEDNGKPAVPTAVYCRLEGDSAVIKVVTDRIDALRQTVANPGDMRNKDLVNPTKRDRIDAIDLIVGANTVKLRKVQTGPGEPQWLLYGSPADPSLVRSNEVNTLLTDLAKPRAAREVLTAPNDAAFAGPELKATVRLWVDGVERATAPPSPGKLPEEPKLKGTPIELAFGKKEGDNVFVRRTVDGAKADLKVAETVLTRVVRTRLDFVDPGLRSLTFIPQMATRLTFNRGPEVFEIEKKDGTASGWEFVKPDPSKGKPADAVGMFKLVGSLSGLAPERVVAEQPTPDDLKRFGLDPVRMKVTVALKDDPEAKEKVYEFGSETEDKKSVYARQAGKPFVLVISKDVFERFNADDLRDPTIYRLDLAKVKRVKLRGWKNLLGPDPLTYQFEKQPTGWVAVSPPTPAGFAPDAGKILQLLALLSAPRAEAFIGGGIKPEYGLDPATSPDAMEITIEQDGLPAITVLLGAKTSDPTRVYGASSAVPDAFTLSPGPLLLLIAKPAGLQR